MSVSYFLRVLWKRKWFLILVPLLGAAIAFIFVNNSGRSYRSVAQLSTGYVSRDRNVESAGDNSRDVEIQFNNLIETINSPLIVGLLSYQLILHDLNESTPFRSSGFESTEVPLSPNEKAQVIQIFQKKLNRFEVLSITNNNDLKLINLLKSYGYDYESIKSALGVNRINFSDYIRISFTSENPLLSAFAVNTISQEFIKYNNSLNMGISGQGVDYYSNLVKKTKEILAQKTLELNAFKESNNVINVDVQSSSKFNQLSELELRKEQELQNFQRYQLELNNINKQLSALIEGPSATTRERDNARIAELQSKIKEANERYISSNRDPSVLAIVEDLRRQLQVELGKADVNPNVVNNKRSELLALKNRAELNLQIAQSSLNQINSAIREIKSNVSGLSSKGTTIQSLMRDVEKANEEYLAALQRYNEAKDNALMTSTSVKQVMYGQPAAQAEPVNATYYTLIAALTGFGLCFLVILLAEVFDFSVKTPSNFTKKTGLEPMGFINELKADTITPEILNKRIPEKGNRLAPFKESLKKIRFEIENSGAKTILLTSTKSGEGKTALIVSLASTIIANGKKVLIIDTNFKNNSLTKIYSAKPTLETAVIKDLPLDDVVTKTNYKNLDVIGCKGGNYSPSEIFPEQKFSQFLKQMGLIYDFILLEGSALNAYADSKELVTVSDKVMGVFSAKSVIKQIDKESIVHLKGLNHKLMGVILNRVKIENMEF